MKLTDEEIEKMSDEFEEKMGKSGLFASSGSFASGAIWLRNVYENQICETCGKTSNCQIKDALSENVWHMVIDFGCNQWEQKK